MTRTRHAVFAACGLAMAIAASLIGQGPASLHAAQPPGVKPPRKLALLVGISDYRLTPTNPQPPEWWPLNCQNDLTRLKAALKERFQFPEADIRVLTVKAATSQGIEDAFRSHLINQASPGDLVFFHYSGHGQQIKDDNGDEIDGLDESLVTANYKSQSAKDGSTTNLRDDKIGELLQALKARMTDPASGKVKGNITVTFDCCFSGTSTRGIPPSGRLVHRGRGWDPQIDGPPPGRASRGTRDEGSGLLEEGVASSTGLVVLTATRSNQTAKEWQDESGQRMGAFTLFLTRGLDKATPNTTYRDIFERVNADLLADVPDQAPSIEGDFERVNAFLLADVPDQAPSIEADQRNPLSPVRAMPPDPYLVVNDYDQSRGVVTLPVGELQGATVGTRFDIFRANSDVKAPANKIAEAEVIKMRSTSCEAQLPAPPASWPQAADMRAARAVEVEHNYGDNVLKTLFEGIADPICREVEKLKVISTKDVDHDNYDALIRPSDPRPRPDGKGEKAGLIMAEMKAGRVRGFNPADPDTPKHLRTFLTEQWKWKFVMSLKNDNPGRMVKVDIRLVPLNVEVTADGKVKRILGVRGDVKPMGNTIQLKPGDYTRLEVRNLSERRKVYITVLNLTPAGAIECAFPDQGDSTLFEPGTDWTPLPGYVFRTTLPTNMGLESDVFKAIATLQETDFRPLLVQPANQRGQDRLRGLVQGKRGGKDHGLARLIGMTVLADDPDPAADKPAVTGSTQRGQRVSLETPDWDTADFIVRVTK